MPSAPRESSFVVLLRPDSQGFWRARTAVKAERSEFIVSLDGGRRRPYRNSSGRRRTSLMPLRSLPLNGSCPGTVACPTSCQPRAASALQPASAPISHRGTLPPLGFFVAPHAAAAPTDYSSADTASAPSEMRSSRAFHRFRPPPARP